MDMDHFSEDLKLIATNLYSTKMKTLIIALLLSYLSAPAIAQIAEKAEDISPLMISEKIPKIKVVSIQYL